MFLKLFALLLIISLSRISISYKWWEENDYKKAYYISSYGKAIPDIEGVKVSGKAKIICGSKSESDYSFINNQTFRVQKYSYNGVFPANCEVEVQYTIKRKLEDICKSALEDKQKNNKKDISCKFGVFEIKQ